MNNKFVHDGHEYEYEFIRPRLRVRSADGSVWFSVDYTEPNLTEHEMHLLMSGYFAGVRDGYDSGRKSIQSELKRMLDL